MRTGRLPLRFSVRRRQTGYTLRLLRLAITLTGNHVSALAETVTGCVTACGGQVDTIVLTMGGDLSMNTGTWEALCTLHCHLSGSGTRLHLVITDRELRDYLAGASRETSGSLLTVHPTLRSAMLASYAELPGPGLVNGAVRAALNTSAEPLAVPGQLCELTHRR